MLNFEQNENTLTEEKRMSNATATVVAYIVASAIFIIGFISGCIFGKGK